MQDDTFLSKTLVAQRYGVTSKTIDRWRERGWFPEPGFSTGQGPGKRDYWSVPKQLVPFERKRGGEAA